MKEKKVLSIVCGLCSVAALQLAPWCGLSASRLKCVREERERQFVRNGVALSTYLVGLLGAGVATMLWRDEDNTAFSHEHLGL